MIKKITVNASKKYDVLIGGGLLAGAGELVRGVTGARKAAVVSDDVVFPLYGDALVRSLSGAGFETVVFVFENGEKSKNLGTAERLYDKLCAARVSRSDVVVALGGGVVGDLAGFCAATYKRGIDFVQIPTTLLAAVDSSVGGKTGVDLPCGKNAVGAFHQPSIVLCDTDTLATLPEEQYLCGCAEVIKYGVIGDEAFFGTLAATPVKEQYGAVIPECVKKKAALVEEDEFDRGRRMLLNFGHTFGHAAESLSRFSMLHGQAVALGMATVARAAAKLGYCGGKTAERIVNIIEKYGLPTKTEFSPDELAREAAGDKKSTGTFVKLVVPKAIGECVSVPVPNDELALWARLGAET